MLKRSWLILLLVVCMGVMLTNTSYGYPTRIGNWGASSSDLYVYAEFNHVTNATKNPTLGKMTINNVKAQSHLFNPAGEDGGLGTFYPEGVLDFEDYVTEPAERNGWWIFEHTFTHDDLFGDIDWGSFLPNLQWTVDEGTEKVVFFHARIEGFSDIDGDGNVIDDLNDPLNPTAWVEGDCTLSGDQHNFICETTGEYWNSKLKGQNK